MSAVATGAGGAGSSSGSRDVPATQATEELALLPAVVVAVLSALPPRFVPSRCFLSACLEFVVVLADAWLTAETSLAVAEEAAGGPPAEALQRQLAEIVGQSCAEVWWADASEAADLEVGPRSSTSLGGAGRAAAHVVLTDLMQRNAAALIRSAREERNRLSGATGARPSTAQMLPGRARFLFGAAWILCALEDVVGSVVVHTTRKSAAVLSSRPTTAGGSRPLTAAASRATTPGKPGSSRGRAPPAASSGSGKTPSKSTCAAAVAAEARLRLLALKHVVAAVKTDDGLRGCTPLERSLADVALGIAPHVDSRELLGVDAYRERIQEWTHQESEGVDVAAAENAMRQALKTSISASASAAAAGGAPAPVPRRRVEAPRAANASSSRPSTAALVQAQCGQWLPKAFVHEFNAEGDEVIDEPSDDDEPGGTRVSPAVGSRLGRAAPAAAQVAPGNAGAAASARAIASAVAAAGMDQEREGSTAPAAPQGLAEPARSRPIGSAAPPRVAPTRPSVPTITAPSAAASRPPPGARAVGSRAVPSEAAELPPRPGTAEKGTGVPPPVGVASFAEPPARGAQQQPQSTAGARPGNFPRARVNPVEVDVPSSRPSTADKGTAPPPSVGLAGLAARSPTSSVPSSALGSARSSGAGGAGPRLTVGALLRSPAGRNASAKLNGASTSSSGYPAAKPLAANNGSRPGVSELWGR